MKRFFKFALVALATAAVAVACQKPEQQPEKIALKGISLNKEAVELAIGAKETLTVKLDPANVTEKPTIEWSSSAPAVATVAEGEVTAVAAGEATITAKAGSFTATCKVTVKGEEQPEPGDFTSPDWANIGAITNGNHTFKFTKDDKNAYFFSERTSEGRYNDIWGGNGYIYFALDFDNDLTTGVELNGNGKYEYIGFIYCFGEKPKVEIVKAGDCLPEEYTVENIIARGSADDNSVKVEYCVPLADLPQLPENFTIYTWGNKDMAKVIYKYPYEAPAPVDNWDYTPSAEYLAEGNLWKAVDADHTINWALDGVTEPSDLAFKESTYSFTLKEASSGYWTTQFRIIPTTDLIMEPATSKTYQLTCKVFSSAGTKLWMKMHPDPSTHWPEAFETAGAEAPDQRISIAAGETKEIVIDINEANNFLTEPMKELLLFDFAPHEADNLIRIKDIVLKEVQGGDVSPEDPPVDNWDYTPSTEYLAASNLWNAVTGNESFYYYHCTSAAWNGEDTIADEVPFMTLNQSTYRLYYKEATAAQWQNQFFIFPKDGHFLPLDASKKYNLKVTLGTTAESAPAFFKIEKYNATHAKREGECFWEKGAFTLSNAEPVVLEYEFTGVDAENITLVFDFGGNPANTYIYIKDIIVEEVGGEGPVAGTVYTLTDANLPTAYEKDAGGSYVETIVTEENIQYNIFTVANYGSGIQIRKEGGYISNHTAFESIKTIKVTCHPDKSWYPSNLVLYAGTAENPSETVITATSDDNTSTFDLSAGNYTHFKLANTSTYAVYLEKVEITGEAGETPAPAANIKLDGDLSDWDAVEGVEAGSFKEFKFVSDADNIYMYFKIKRSKIIAAKTEPFVFNWRRYIAFGIDADNNAETGTAVTFAGMNIPGCEIGGNFYPFRGTASEASGTDNVEIVNGVEEQGGVTTEIGSNVPDGADKKVSAFGKVDDEFVYVEAGFARADVGSPAAGTIKIQLSLAWDLTDILEYSLK